MVRVETLESCQLREPRKSGSDIIVQPHGSGWLLTMVTPSQSLIWYLRRWLPRGAEYPNRLNGTIIIIFKGCSYAGLFRIIIPINVVYFSHALLIISSSSTQPQVQFPNIPVSLLINFIPTEQDAWPGSTSDTPNQGLPPSFLDTLDRVDKKSLKNDDICPICATPYLEDQYPLVVKLRCGHKFDLECIGIWFKQHSSCPMCRQGVEKRKPVVIPDDEEEYDDNFS